MALIVAAENDIDMAELLIEMLGRRGHTVYTAANGPAALELIDLHHPDLVILDHHMPGLTGLQVADHLRANVATAAIPLLMLSTAAPSGSERVVDQVLTKPVSSAHLIEAAQNLLDAPQPPADPMTDLARLRHVADLLDDLGPRQRCDADLFAANVAVLLGAQTTALNLALNDSILIRAAYGLPPLLADIRGVPAEWAPCTTIVRTGRPLLLTDTHTDPAHAYNPAVTIDAVRSYAGAPLRTDTGHIIGTLCVMDQRPYAFTTGTIETLTALAARALQYLQPSLS